MVTRFGRKYPVARNTEEFAAFKKTPESKIHAIYEQGMFEVDAPSLLAAVNQAVEHLPANPDAIASGHDAALATMRLMHAAQERLSPRAIIKADNPALGTKARARAFWENDEVREATIMLLAGSVRLLADLWTSAWKEGGGEGLAEKDIREYSEDEMSAIYRKDAKFIPSLSLNEMAESGRFEAS